MSARILRRPKEGLHSELLKRDVLGCAERHDRAEHPQLEFIGLEVDRQQQVYRAHLLAFARGEMRTAGQTAAPLLSAV